MTPIIITTPPILLVLMGMALVLMVLFSLVALIYQRKLALAAAALASTVRDGLIDHDERLMALERDFDEGTWEGKAIKEAEAAFEQRRQPAYLRLVPPSNEDEHA